jgi:hypothetical protein
MSTDTAPPVHDLLLELAGRLDDDLLAWARELLAVGEGGQAVELATAALAAERVVLPPSLRAALVAAARDAHTDLDVDAALPPPAVEDGTPHRFEAGAAPGDAVVAALTALPARRLAGCTLHLTWRRTPAGTAPGPLPHAVVLVEADADRSADVLTYLLATELDRAGVPASVEVYTDGAPLPAYHVAALQSAREVLRRAGGQPAPTPADDDHGTAGTAPASLFAVSSADPPRLDEPTVALPGKRAATGRRRRPEPVADAPPEPAAPEPAAPEPAASEPAASEPAAPKPAAPEPDAPEPEGPVDTDPFNGPLRVPLLEPLLEPTGLEQDGPDSAEVIPRTAGPADTDPAQAGSEETGRTPVRAEEPGSGDADRPAPPDRRGSDPSPPARPADPAEWERDWRSGEWAMPRPARPAQPNPPPDRSPTDGPFDVFTTPRRPPDAPDLPSRPAPAALAPDPAASGAGPATGRSPSGEVSLFDSPTARVGPRSQPQRPVAARSTAPPDEPSPESPAPPRPAVPPAGREPISFEDDPLFGAAPEEGRFRDPESAPSGHTREPDGRPAERRPATEPRPERSSPDLPRRPRRPRPDEPTGLPPAFLPSARTPVPEPARPTPDAAPAPPAHPDPEPSALLSGTERDLLAQLQAELAARDPRPRPYRRAGQNGRGVNGHTGGVNGVNGHGGEGSGRPDGGRPDLGG